MSKFFTFGLYNPFIVNTKEKFRRMFGFNKDE